MNTTYTSSRTSPDVETARSVGREQKRIRVFEIVYLALALNFFLPALSYIAAPALAADTMDRINRLLGGGAWPTETSQLWHMLAVGNVMTLGFMCLLLAMDLRRFFPLLPALCFLKAFSAIFSLVLGFSQALPAFFAVFALDGSTTVAMLFFAIRAHRASVDLAANRRLAPLWVRLLLLRPQVIEAKLVVARRIDLDPLGCSLEQIGFGVLRMWARLLFRPSSVGTCEDPVQPGWRARALSWRPLRFPFLVAERAIAPLDMSGLLSSRERIIRHLLGAHHDQIQMIYDLELLLLHPGSLDELHARCLAVVEGSDPRAAWLRDLVVFTGYHERLLSHVEQARAGTMESSSDADISLRAFFRWCATQPPGGSPSQHQSQDAFPESLIRAS